MSGSIPLFKDVEKRGTFQPCEDTARHHEAAINGNGGIITSRFPDSAAVHGQARQTSEQTFAHVTRTSAICLQWKVTCMPFQH